MKVAIVTITDGANYGNRLQNYAMQEVLKKIGCDVYTIQRISSRDLFGRKKAFVIIKDFVKKILGRKNTTFQYRKRKKLFEAFNAKYILFSNDTLGYNKFSEDIDSHFDFFVCGSDQIWNTKFDIIKEDIVNYLAAFASPLKRISYAASFGTDNIEAGYESLFSTELKKFKALGVRESSGNDIIKKYAQRNDSVLVLDPTLLLSVDDWIKIEKKPKYIENERVVLTYFLGGRSHTLDEYVKKIASDLTALPINLEGEFLTDGEIEDRRIYKTSPDEFIWLIHNSECVLTDSFHATAISILFGKKFCVFHREAAEKGNDMSGRIATLLGMFELSDMMDDLDHPTKKPEKLDINKINKVLSYMRDKSNRFLLDALMNDCHGSVSKANENRTRKKCD